MTAGFTAETFTFLEQLAENNERPWFEANKPRYERHVREPAMAFIRAMAPRLAEVAPSFVADDRKVGGSLMRIFRDTRFAKDKTPYKTNIGIQFRHVSGADVHAPGIYLHVAPEGSFLAVGCWTPEPPALDQIRRRIATDPDGFLAVVQEPSFSRTFVREDHGEPLKRAPKGFDPAHPLIEELKRKSHMGSVKLTRTDVCSGALPDRVAEHLGVAVPFLRYLCDAMGAAA